MMKSRKELLQGYIYLSTKFYKSGTITKDFRDFFQPETASKIPALKGLIFKVSFYICF